MFWPPIDTNNLSQSELHESRGGTGIRWNFYDERPPFSCYRFIDGRAVVNCLQVSAWRRGWLVQLLFQMQLPHQVLGKLWKAVRCDNTSWQS